VSSRSRRRKARTIAAREATRKAGPTLVREDRGDGFTLWALSGSNAIVELLTPDPTWPRDLQACYRRRRHAALTGQCPCGAVWRIVGMLGPNVEQRAIEHRPACPASDESYFALLERFDPQRKRWRDWGAPSSAGEA
jgi:hypothetical protein